MTFLTSLDIENRALQHVGAPRIGSSTDNSRGAAEVAFAYDKVRRSELRRVVWRFAIRRAVLRPLTSATLLLVPPTYNAAITYGIGAIVSYSGLLWSSIAKANLANTPGIDGTVSWIAYFGPMSVVPWAQGQFYTGELINFTDGDVYVALATNSDQNPPASGSWALIGETATTTASFVFSGPLGYNNQSSTQLSVYRLPNNYLRVAPQDQKVAGTSVSNVSAGMRYNDWQFEDQYFITQEADNIFFRFVADITLVSSMEDIFCEAASARLGLAINETITQSAEKFKVISAYYDKTMHDAEAVNAIEIGSIEKDEQAYMAGPRPAAAGVPAGQA